jgi:hypothetical protein
MPFPTDFAIASAEHVLLAFRPDISRRSLFSNIVRVLQLGCYIAFTAHVLTSLRYFFMLAMSWLQRCILSFIDRNCNNRWSYLADKNSTVLFKYWKVYIFISSLLWIGASSSLIEEVLTSIVVDILTWTLADRKKDNQKCSMLAPSAIAFDDSTMLLWKTKPTILLVIKHESKNISLKSVWTLDGFLRTYN